MAVALAMAAVGLAVAGFALAAGFTVTLTSKGPEPPRLTVSLGDTVTFVNNTPDARVLKSDDEAFATATIPSGGQYEYVATNPGNIGYRFGTERTDMGAVTVKRAGSVSLESKVKTLTFGKTVTLSGLAVPAGFPVAIEGRGRSGSGWAQIAKATPASEGAFALVVKPLLGTQYRASLFDGALRSSRVIVKVRPSMRLASTARKSRTDRIVKFRAYVAPRDAAPRISLAAYNPQRKSWRNVSTQRLRNGTAVIPWKVTQGTSRLRLSIDRGDVKPGLETGVSNTIVFIGVGEPSEPARQRRDRNRNGG